MGGPNPINNLNNPVNGSGYNPRQGGAAKAPNLKEFVLTIDDFRQFASGKYNAGVIRGDQIGAHRAWERLESVDIDPSEAASIRLAFAFALENAGVSVAKMAAACKRLGLEADFSFSESDAKVYTALSREEVRDVIEQSLGGRLEKGRKIIKEKPDLLIEKDDIINIKDDDDNNIINDDKIINDDDNNIIINSKSINDVDDDDDEIIIRNDSGNKNYIIERDDIDDKTDHVDQKDGKYVAQHNFDKLVDLLYSDYSAKPVPLTKAEVRSIIQRVDNWEEKLSKCKMDNTATRLGNMNRDLINFITLNMEVIQKGIDEAIASKKKN